jgi:hypothetical protein
MWAVSRYDDVMAVLKDPQRFSNVAYAFEALPSWLDRMPLGQSMLAQDPPAHTKLRALVTKAFGPASVARLEPRIKAFVNKLADEVVRRQEVDFVEEFAMRLPAFVIGDMLGLDASLHGHFKKWADDFMSLTGKPPPEQIPSIQQSVKDAEHYFSQLLEENRRNPREDLINELMKAEIDGQRLTYDELMSFCFLLLVAGLETTTHLLSNTLLVLSQQPEALERVLKDRSLIPNLVEEVLRYEPPLHVLHRRTKTPVTLGGVTIPQDATVLLLVAAAMRDERYFPEPDRFLLTREKPAQIPFGHGAHFCIGATLARLEVRLGLDALLSRISGLSRPPQTINWVLSLTTRGPSALRLRFQPA